MSSFANVGAAVLLCGVTASSLTAAAVAISYSAAAGVADNAALAAADALNGFVTEDPCALATRVAAERDAQLVSCELFESSGAAKVTVLFGAGYFSRQITAFAAPNDAATML